MDLTVLGCAGTFPGPDSPCSGYLVEAEGFRLLVDVGNGVLTNLQRCRGLLDVDAVIVTHLHADHVVDLIPYAYARHYHPRLEPACLPVLGPSGTFERLANMFDAPVGTLEKVYDITVAESGVREIGPFRVTLDRVHHPVETYGVRLEHDGNVLAYSSDTGETDALVGLARDADVFLCEASFEEGVPNPPGIHLTGREAGVYAARAGAGSLLLTHMVAWHDPEHSLAEAAEVYDGPIAAAAACGAHRIGG